MDGQQKGQRAASRIVTCSTCATEKKIKQGSGRGWLPIVSKMPREGLSAKVTQRRSGRSQEGGAFEAEGMAHAKAQWWEHSFQEQRARCVAGAEGEWGTGLAGDAREAAVGNR